MPGRRAALLLACAGLAQAAPPAVKPPAPAPAEPGTLRVCVADLAYPPHITLDPKRPGLRERQFLEAGQRAGLRVSLHYFPIRRCHRMVHEGELDAVYLAATPASLVEYRFPLDAKGQPDRARRLSEEQVQLVRRRDSPVRWDGKAFDAPPRLGSRAGLRMAQAAAHQLGLQLDDSALNAPQALRKLHAGRHDLVVLLRADVKTNQALIDELGLEVLPQPLARFDTFMAASLHWPAQREAELEAWWSALARWQP